MTFIEQVLTILLSNCSIHFLNWFKELNSMCTAFVHKGKDRICGFNMDLPGSLDWKLFTDRDCFYVGIRPVIRPELLPEGMHEIPDAYLPCDEEYLKIHGLHRNGNFGNQLNALNYHKAPFEVGDDAIPLYSLVDRFVSGRTDIDAIIGTVRKKRTVNMPSAAIGLPDLAMHSLLSDKEGRILMIEPGNGYAEVWEDYAVMSNFPMLILPRDMTEEQFGYYGVDRYETAVTMIADAGSDFSPEQGLAVLKAVKQVQYAPTRISFVYSQNENKVYYALEGDFDHIMTHQFAE